MAVEQQEQWLAQLREMCQRDGALEIALSPKREGDHPSYVRVRLLAYEPDAKPPHLIVEHPAYAGSTGFQREVSVEVLAMRSPYRFGFSARVIEPLRYQLNQRVVLPALKLTAPTHFHPVQRRRFYRVDTVGAGLPLAVFLPVVESDDEAAAPQPAVKSWSAPILNLSGGGLAVTLPAGAARNYKLGQQFRCRISLPSHHGPLELPVTLVQHRNIRDDIWYLGFEITEPEERARKLCENILCRFATALQRSQLARRKRDE